MRHMYDSINAAAIPAGAEVVAGYIDGLYKWKDEDWARFPNAVKVKIAISHNTNDGHVLDVDPGNATPGGAFEWGKMRRAAGIEPTVYCNLSTWPAVEQAFLDAGILEPLYWIAQWKNSEALPLHTIAHQYTNNKDFDVSVIADYWPGVDTPQGQGQAKNALNSIILRLGIILTELKDVIGKL